MLSDNTCPCGSGSWYTMCCKPYIAREKIAETPEVLMRSRYSAYSQAKLRYIVDTQCGEAAIDFDRASAKRWAKAVTWLGLSVQRAWQPSNEVGFVEFTASFVADGEEQTLEEISEFHCIDGRWFYVGKSTS